MFIISIIGICCYYINQNKYKLSSNSSHEPGNGTSFTYYLNYIPNTKRGFEHYGNILIYFYNIYIIYDKTLDLKSTWVIISSWVVDPETLLISIRHGQCGFLITPTYFKGIYFRPSTIYFNYYFPDTN